MDDEGMRVRWLDSYLLRERGLSPKTARSYGWAAARLEAFLHQTIWEVSAADARRYLLDSDDSPTTKHLVLAALKSAHRFDCLERDVAPNGILVLKPPRIHRPPRRRLTGDEMRYILSQAVEPHEVRVTHLPAFAGTRVSEAGPGLLEWRSDRIVVMGKYSKVREIPLASALHEVRDVILSITPTTEALAYRARKMSERIGLTFQVHDLRHKFARTLEDGEAHPHVVKDLLGHAADVTTLYSGVSWRKKSAAVRLANY